MLHNSYSASRPASRRYDQHVSTVRGLARDQVDLDGAELYVGEQLQRVRHELVRREVKTETSEAPLPLPELCVAALKIRRERQDVDHDRAGDGWIDTGLVAHVTIAAVCCCHKIQKGRFLDRNRPLSWVELRGFEPLTPSMRTELAAGRPA